MAITVALIKGDDPDQDLDLHVDINDYEDTHITLKQGDDWILLTPEQQRNLYEVLKARV